MPDGVVAQMRELTRCVDGVGDLMSERDLTRLSLGFRGSVGDSFKFKGGPFAGFVGVIASLKRLDVDGAVGAYVELLGGTQEVVVSHRFVGPIIQRAVAGELVAA